MGVKFGKFHPHQCNVSPLRGEKPQNRPLSKRNTGRFALRAMLPVINLFPVTTSDGDKPCQQCNKHDKEINSAQTFVWELILFQTLLKYYFQFFFQLASILESFQARLAPSEQKLWRKLVQAFAYQLQLPFLSPKQLCESNEVACHQWHSCHLNRYHHSFFHFV